MNKIKELAFSKKYADAELYGEQVKIKLFSFAEVQEFAGVEDSSIDRIMDIVSSSLLDKDCDPIFTIEELRNDIAQTELMRFQELVLEFNGVGKTESNEKND
jgi:hypothetical protein